MALPPLETLLYRVDDGVATVTLNRPEKLNAFTTRMRDELVAVFVARVVERVGGCVQEFVGQRVRELFDHLRGIVAVRQAVHGARVHARVLRDEEGLLLLRRRCQTRCQVLRKRR